MDYVTYCQENWLTPDYGRSYELWLSYRGLSPLQAPKPTTPYVPGPVPTVNKHLKQYEAELASLESHYFYNRSDAVAFEIAKLKGKIAYEKA